MTDTYILYYNDVDIYVENNINKIQYHIDILLQINPFLEQYFKISHYKDNIKINHYIVHNNVIVPSNNNNHKNILNVKKPKNKHVQFNEDDNDYELFIPCDTKKKNIDRSENNENENENDNEYIKLIEKQIEIQKMKIEQLEENFEDERDNYIKVVEETNINNKTLKKLQEEINEKQRMFETDKQIYHKIKNSDTLLIPQQFEKKYQILELYDLEKLDYIIYNDLLNEKNKEIPDHAFIEIFTNTLYQ